MSLSVNYHVVAGERINVMRDHRDHKFRTIEFGQRTVNRDSEEYPSTEFVVTFMVRDSDCADFAAELRRAADFLEGR